MLKAVYVPHILLCINNKKQKDVILCLSCVIAYNETIRIAISKSLRDLKFWYKAIASHTVNYTTVIKFYSRAVFGSIFSWNDKSITTLHNIGE